MRKYKKEDEISYSLGTEPTLELLLRHPDSVESVYIHSKQKDNEIFRKILNQAERNKIPVIRDNDKVFNILSDKDNCYIIGIFKKFKTAIDFNKNHVVLVNPSNTGNLGTIIRTTIGFGIKDIAIITPAVDIFDPKVIRASMGAFFGLRFQHFDSFENYLKQAKNRPIFPFMLDGAVQLDKINIPNRFTIVFGNEATGLPPEFKKYGQTVLIKHYQTIDSLNLCNAVSIGLYEFTKGTIK